MSKRIKDYKWEISPPKKKKGWLAHDVSPSGNEILLLSPSDAYSDIWKEFLLVNIQPDGHASHTMVSPKGMQWISFCNFLPDGNILAIGLKGKKGTFSKVFSGYDDPLSLFTKHLESGDFALMCTILDGSSLRPMSEVVFSPDSDATRGLLRIKDMIGNWHYSGREGYDMILGEGHYRIDFSYMDPDSMPEYFQMVFQGYWCLEKPKERYGDVIGVGNISIDFKRDLSDIKIPNVGGFSLGDGWTNHLEKRWEIEPPQHYPDRNWGSTPRLVDYATFRVENEAAIAMLHSAGRKIIVSRKLGRTAKSHSKMKISLDFGQTSHSSSETFSQNFSGGVGLGADNISMAFTTDAGRLTVLSHLPYHSGTDSEGYYNTENYRWFLHSYDVDGRFDEIERTKLRKEGRWKLQSERKIRRDTLTNAGLPFHIARLMALSKISDKEGIQLFRYLRSSGAPDVNTNQQDSLEKIDELAFSGELSKEDAKWLIENRNHVELIEAIIQGDFSIKRAKDILIDMGFANYPEAVTRVVDGAEPETVAMIFGINLETSTRTEKRIEEKTPPPTEKETEPKKERRGFFRRRSRFS